MKGRSDPGRLCPTESHLTHDRDLDPPPVLDPQPLAARVRVREGDDGGGGEPGPLLAVERDDRGGTGELRETLGSAARGGVEVAVQGEGEGGNGGEGREV